MGSLQDAKGLASAGRFADALRTLDASTLAPSSRLAGAVLKTELLERLGRHQQARHHANALLRSKGLSPSELGMCELVLARVLAEEGQLGSAVAHLQRSINGAVAAGEFGRACWSQLKLLVIVADQSGPEAAAALLADLRANAARSGDPQIFAALHLHVAQIEAKRSLVTSARRHVRLALEMLRQAPNVWLEAVAEHIQVAVAIMRSDLKQGIVHARRAVELAEQSGAAHSQATSLANFGNVLYLVGSYAQSTVFYERAMQAFLPRSDNYRAGLDARARIKLAEDNIPDSERLLDEIDASSTDSSFRSRYVFRHALLTRVNVLARRGCVDEAMKQVETVAHLARLAGDDLLLHQALLSKADLLQQSSRVEECLPVLEQIIETIASQPPDLYAFYERVLACALARLDQRGAARVHFDRARRTYETLGHAPGLTELGWAYNLAGARHDKTPLQSSERSAEGITSHGIAALFAHVGQHELIAREIVELLNLTGCVASVATVLRAPDGSEEVIGGAGDVNHAAAERRLVVGSTSERSVELVLRPRRDPESAATINGVTLLLASLHDLERARAEREERATLWPVEDLPSDGDRSAIAGHMREQMTMARRVAKTNVNVLITGESGTGKDILARAIHTFSDRADQPFVPFNCTAVPRDLLESQLFGHRRGAFTGADRDQPGLIRSAREGTLFLDEVGELGLDLQPKLLRFLESGEISPLGEPSPLTVNVRVIAATNSHLEDAVREGRFREDLFYRLNVVRLSIKPLRERRDEIPGLVNHFVTRAAGEFKKGVLAVAEETMEHLLLYRWPGNVRQLQNEVRRMVALAEPNSTLGPNAISDAILAAMPTLRPASISGSEIAVSLHDKLLPTLARIECEMIKAALHTHRGKMEQVAKALGISRKGLYLKRRRLGL